MLFVAVGCGVNVVVVVVVFVCGVHVVGLRAKNDSFYDTRNN